MSNKGFFVISLDFELFWGMFDKVTLAEYGEHIKGVHTAIPEMLAVFKEYNIHATWATVGMLLFETKNELLRALPKEQPLYANMAVSSYEYLKKAIVKETETDDPYHFGATLLQQILQTPNQEFGSHTFSHYYCIDGSKNSAAVFAADCQAFSKVAARFNQQVTSIVFPRNQTTLQALAICKEQGLTAYRGTPDHFLYTSKTDKAQTNIFLRALRLIDAYINISGPLTYSLFAVQEDVLANVRGSFFLRPYSHLLRFIEKIKIERIKKSMTHAAKHNEIFHLWWHPHNFGINRKENLANLISLLEHFKCLQETYGMQSANMREITENAHIHT